ncbi:GDSL-type esterase/lipase family protein [Desulfopila inferna]|uniref:GDSL-type esterase/lipase family protein n=1 Tax=Desulfopila inferna TaxID=468528 RepID=UPI001964B8F4|nr:GDSL-type esterase/lipase family protein [Desulfopila inferna]
MLQGDHRKPLSVHTGWWQIISGIFCILCVFLPAVGYGGDSETTSPTHGTDFSAPEQKRQSNIDIVLIGASYAEGLKLNEVAGMTMINKGVGGQQSFEMLDRFQDDVINLNPRKVVIWGFINDIFRADPGKMDDAIVRIQESYREMVRLSRENSIEPLLATEITMGPRGGFKETIVRFIAGLMGKVSYQERVNLDVRKVNEWLKKYAAEQGLSVLEFQQVLADEEGLMREKKFTQDDGSHISEEGYKILSQYMINNEELFRKRLQ